MFIVPSVIKFNTLLQEESFSDRIFFKNKFINLFHILTALSPLLPLPFRPRFFLSLPYLIHSSVSVQKGQASNGH